MQNRVIWKRCVGVLTALAFIGLVGLAALLGTAAVLDALGDPSGGVALRYTALGVGIVWLVDLVSLVLALAAGELFREDSRSDGEMSAPAQDRE